MQRTFASVYKALERVVINVEGLIQLLTQQVFQQGQLEFQGYAIFALDHTPYPRKNAPTVADRGYVHGAEGTVVGSGSAIASAFPQTEHPLRSAPNRSPG